MSNLTKLLVIGGFLGAGKTTSILNIAKYLAYKGMKVAIVTNDQGSDLVDTNFLIKAGLPVLEVTGGCFCCNFEEFTNKVNELSRDLLPDVVLAEPVGSCTDLIATIFKPIQLNFIRQFSLGPLSIVADPRRVKKLMMESNSIKSEEQLFPSEINYLFKKQLEEADIIVLNKVDTLSKEEASAITQFLHSQFPGTEVIAASAKEDIGIEHWINTIDNFKALSKPSLNIDYEIYARAEEFLGWLNTSAVISSANPHDGNAFIYNLMETVKDKLKANSVEIAHLKIYEVSENDWAKASITSIYDNVDFNRRLKEKVLKANLIINARVNTVPEKLETIVLDTLKDVCSNMNINSEFLTVQCFKPGRPQPAFRIQ